VSYYDRDGKPMSMLAWAHAFKRPRGIGRTEPCGPGGPEVSTVWLGLDHAFMGGPPLIFETLVFGGVLDGEMNRYSTEEQARQGHEDMVLRVRAAEEAT
jgi:hypothetical protein